MFGKALIGLVLAAIVIYGLIEARPLLLGPSLSISSPSDGESVPNGILLVSGRVLRANALTLNGVSVLPDEKGGFSSTLTFSHGTSILEFMAKDRFGRSITRIRTIYVP